MGSFLSSNKISKEDVQMALDIISSNTVVVFCKTYCGYCNKVKQLFNQLRRFYKTIELDEESDGGEMQAALTESTGQRTVPNVFIGGINIGGCDSSGRSACKPPHKCWCHYGQSECLRPNLSAGNK